MAVDSNAQVIIDGRFFVPKGVVDVRQANSESDSDAYQYVADVMVDPTPDPSTAIAPMPPTSYSIVEQRVRISSDGSAVVDVTLDFPDVAGVESIDVRITKA